MKRSLTPLQLETLLGTNLLEFSTGGDFGALKGLKKRKENIAGVGGGGLWSNVRVQHVPRQRCTVLFLWVTSLEEL